ncbi:alpha/beta fold hydrolase [Paracoccus endophyticus]|uniref:alpha/beta fold hydrolase n=1 Tax=Paracoccus endophyticus TaxID=2233774 RepID=UPI000DD6B228|nr:alpha/beta hydrolase [Paracoccus endophyticus]
MTRVRTSDDVELYVKDWGQGRPVVLIHGWPLNADAWEEQAQALVDAGYRVVSYDRRGFGRSDQPDAGYDYDTLADDLAAVINDRGLTDAALVGFSMGGGEVARYMSRHAGRGVSRVAFISSVVPGVVQSEANPEGAPGAVLDQMKAAIRADRPAFFREFFPSFYGMGWVKRPVSQAVLDWTWGMAMMASPIATIACVDAFGRTDFTGDVGSIRCPTLIVHGSGDQNVPIKATSARLASLLPHATFKDYDGAPHGIPATHAADLNRDLLELLRA